MVESESEQPISPPDERHTSADSSSLDLSPFRTLSRRHRRILAVLIPLAVVAIVYAVEFNRRHEEVQRLVNEIKNSGGEVYMKSPLYYRLFARMRDHLTFPETMVFLQGDRIDDEWLRQRDDLAVLDIDILSVAQSPLSGRELARLVQKHSLKQLTTSFLADSDLVAVALSDSKSLRCAGFGDSDLTDAGLRTLPLENLNVVDVGNSAVTPDGLQELNRCRQLNALWLDGRQFDDSIADILHKKQVHYLSLEGESVTDEDLRLVARMDIRRIELAGTSVTQDGVADLQVALPNCQIRIYEDPDPPHEESTSD